MGKESFVRGTWRWWELVLSLNSGEEVIGNKVVLIVIKRKPTHLNRSSRVEDQHVDRWRWLTWSVEGYCCCCCCCCCGLLKEGKFFVFVWEISELTFDFRKGRARRSEWWSEYPSSRRCHLPEFSLPHLLGAAQQTCRCSLLAQR